MCLLHRWQVQVVVGSDQVGLGGPGFDSVFPARIPHGWLTEKTVRCISQRRVWWVAAFVGDAGQFGTICGRSLAVCLDFVKAVSAHGSLASSPLWLPLSMVF